MVQLPIDEDDTIQALADAIRLLSGREQRLLDLCYCEGKTLSQAARVMGFSRSWACRLHARALATLRATVPKSAAFPYRQPVTRNRETCARLRADGSSVSPNGDSAR